MQITETIHSLRIPFSIPIAPGKSIDRFVYITLILGHHITLIDTGVKGAHTIIFDYIEKLGRRPEEISTIIFSHSHPDHIGSAPTIKKLTGCTVFAHEAEKNWIEDTERQKSERPVPGFDLLVEGPVKVDEVLTDAQNISLEEDIQCQVLHTPGHSKGSVSLLFEGNSVLFTGDALPLPGDLPIYDDIALTQESIKKIKAHSQKVNTILSSWEEPIQGNENINQRIAAGTAYLERIHHAVVKVHRENGAEGMELCQSVVGEMGLPPFAANPLIARAFMSSLLVAGKKDLFAN